ncbi:MAG TPA: flavin reductase family protein [Acidimicrobiia bacterium]|jgi:flavin reductase (DIM6/NTAB) family NADH-FMN oxidoreductase RutF
MALTEKRSQPVEPEVFRRAMSSFASGVNLITAYDPEGQPHGMTATAFCPVSLDPPLVLVCINRDSRTRALVDASGRFGVSMLAEGSAEISVHCARPGAAKALPGEWLVDDGDARTPVLGSALVHADCDIHEQHEVGTHTLFIGRVRHVSFGTATGPLLYFRGTYHRLEEPSAPVEAPRVLRDARSSR